MEDDFIFRYMALYTVKWESDSAYEFVRCMLWNETLLDYYWEKTANTNAEAQEPDPADT